MTDHLVLLGLALWIGILYGAQTARAKTVWGIIASAALSGFAVLLAVIALSHILTAMGGIP